MSSPASQVIFQKAFEAYQNGQFKLALVQLELTLKFAKYEHDDRLMCGCLGLYGEVYRVLGDLKTAEQYCLEALNEARKAGFPDDYMFMAIATLGDIKRAQGQTIEARRLYERLLSVIGNPLQDPLQCHLLDQIAGFYFQERQYSLAAGLLQKVIDFQGRLPDLPGKADSLKKLGLCERSMANYASAIESFGQSHRIAIACGDIPTSIIALAEQAFTYAQTGDHKTAVEILYKVNSTRQSLNYHAAEEVDRAALAHSLTSLGRYEDALQQLDFNIRDNHRYPTFQEQEDRARCYIETNRPHDAISIFESLIIEARKQKDQRLEANSLGNLGHLYHTLGESSRALELFNQALHIHQLLGDAQGENLDHKFLAEIQKDLRKPEEKLLSDEEAVHIYMQEESFKAQLDARKHFENMLEKANQEGNFLLIGFALESLGTIARDQGALEDAIAMYRKALELGDRIDHIMRSGIFNNLGIVYRLLERYETAIECYKDAINMIEEDFPGTRDNNLLTTMPRANLCRVYLHLGKIDLAEETYLEIPQEVSDLLERLNILEIHIDILSAKASDLKGLIESLNEMVSLCKKAGLALREAFGYEHLGEIYQKDLKDLHRALSLYDNAILLLQRPDHELHRARLWYRRSTVQFELGQTNEAYQYMVQAIGVLEKQRASLKSRAYRQRQVVNTLSWYALIIRICDQLGHFGEAIEYLERFRSQNLVSLLSEQNISPSSAVPSELLERFQELQIKLRKLDLLLTQEQAKGARSPNLSDLHKEHERRVIEFNKLLGEIATFDSTFPQLNRVEPINIGTVLSLIPNDCATAVLEFFVDTNETIAFLIIPGDPPLQNTFHLKNLGKQALYSIAANILERHDQWKENLSSTLYDLYQDIFNVKSLTGMTIADCLRKQNVKRLILIPHSELHLIPLHATWHLQEGEKLYLVDQYEVTYTPSFQILQHCLNRNGSKYEHLAAFADTLGNLSFAKVEVDRISQYFQSPQIFRAGEATLANVHNSLPTADVVHFACHGKFEPNSPLQSSLALADGSLTLAALFEQTKVKSGCLVSLAACKSGVIRPDSTDEYLGLPAGFLFAGATCVLSSLWPVYDLSTCLLMMRFYHNICQNGFSVSESLRESQIWLRTATKQDLMLVLEKPMSEKFDRLTTEFSNSDRPFEHPFYWAAFQAIGVSWNSIQKSI